MLAFYFILLSVGLQCTKLSAKISNTQNGQIFIPVNGGNFFYFKTSSLKALFGSMVFFSKKGDSTENMLGKILEVQLLMNMYF
jgi:hypothetical protein